MVPEILVDPVPLMVSALALALTEPETVNRFEELFVQACGLLDFHATTNGQTERSCVVDQNYSQTGGSVDRVAIQG